MESRITYFSGGLPVEGRDRRDLEALGIPIVEGELTRTESDGVRVVGVRVDDDNAEGGVTNPDAGVVSTRLDVRTDSFGAVVATRRRDPARRSATGDLASARPASLWL